MGFSLDFTPDENDTNNFVGKNDGGKGFRGPSVTLSDKDRAAIGGGVFGGIGAAAGYHYGDKVGNWSENQWNNITGKNSRIAQEDAAKEADKLRRQGIIDEYGARQQADMTAYAGLRRTSDDSPGVLGAQNAPGSIAAGISSSGTF